MAFETSHHMAGQHSSSRRTSLAAGLSSNWKPSSLHTVSPYIGKMRPELAAWAISCITSEGDLVYDPFCGSGTVLLEGWAHGRRVVGTDLNPYAWLISQAKLFPYQVCSDDDVDRVLNDYVDEVDSEARDINLDKVDPWVASFYHPETLRDLLAWVRTLSRHQDAFALACLLGIAHHQRPGFLSYPASHTIPYLRTSKFPESQFGELYSYREVLPRLKRKILRACKKMPKLNFSISRSVQLVDAASLVTEEKVDSIITSPPYMGQLDYARDNRLRLHLLGVRDWEQLNREVAPTAVQFIQHMGVCLTAWRKILKPGGTLAILVGDTTNSTRRRLDTLVTDLVKENWQDYELRQVLESHIPDARRTRKNCKGSKSESLLVFKFRP